MAASQGDIQALEQAALSGSDMDCADYDNRWVLPSEYKWRLTLHSIERPCTWRAVRGTWSVSSTWSLGAGWTPASLTGETMVRGHSDVSQMSHVSQVWEDGRGRGKDVY